MLVRHIPATSRLGSEQWLHRFANGYGASVVRGWLTYGGEAGLYELAVARWTGPDEDDWVIDYDTSVTPDVLGYLTEADVDRLLAEIEALPPSAEAEEAAGADGASRE